MTKKVIYIKLTNACNLKCKHCYNEIMQNHSFMSDKVLNQTIQYIKTFKNTEIDLHIHGGEPFLFDLDKIEYLISELKEYTFKWTVTTNLIYEITDKHLNIFKKMLPYDNNPLILTSWDYKIRFKDNQQSLWENNVKYLIEKGIQVQPIVCLTNLLIENLKPEDIFSYFKRFNIKRFNFERITNTGNALINNLRPTNEDLQNWLLSAYKIYEKQNDIEIPLFTGLEYSLKGIFLGCRNRQCTNNVITINPNGTIASCPNTADYTFNDIFTNNLQVSKKDYITNKENSKDLRCLICEFYKYCNGDCFQLEFDNTNCPGLKKLYEYLLK